MWVDNDVYDFKNNTSVYANVSFPPTYEEYTMCGEDSWVLGEYEDIYVIDVSYMLK